MSRKNQMKKNNKKQNNRKNRRVATVNRLPSFPNSRNLPFPVTMRTKLRYNDIYTLNAVSGFAKYIYSGNSAFDPDYTGIGHQCLYWDQISAIYAKYVVLASKITFKGNVDTGSNQGIIATVTAYYQNTFSDSIAGLQESIESPFNTYKMFINAPVKQEVMTLGYRSYELLGVSERELIENPDFWASTSSDPPYEWFYKLAFANTDGAVTAFGVSMTVSIEYDVMFGQFAEVAPSISKSPVVRVTKLEDFKTNKSDKFEQIIENVSATSTSRDSSLQSHKSRVNRK